MPGSIDTTVSPLPIPLASPYSPPQTDPQGLIAGLIPPSIGQAVVKPALGGILNCPYELIAPRVLDQVSDGTGLYRVGDAAALQDARKGDHLDARHLGLDACDRLNPVHVWHEDVHQYDVWPQPACLLDLLATIGSLADHRDRRLLLEEHPQPLPHNPVVVDHQDLDRIAATRLHTASRRSCDHFDRRRLCS